MKIYFCDGCNESIPWAEVQSGQVTTIKAKMFCRNCIPPSSLASPGAAPAGRTPRSARGRPVSMVLIVVLLTGWTLWRDQDVLLGRADPLDPAATQSLQPTVETRSRLTLVENELRAAEERRADLARALATLQSSVEGARAESQGRDKQLATVGDEVQRLSVSQAASGQLVERVQINANRVGQVELRVDALSQAVAAHEEKLDVGLPAMPVAGDVMSGGESEMAAGTGIDPELASEYEGIRRKLLDPEPDRRFEGVDDIERGNHRALAVDLLPLLQDEDMFIRLFAMNVLGNFGYEEAVPALFDVLEDGNASIRKTAAETLVQLTGYDPGFEHKAGAADRARAVKTWREWFDARGA